MNTVPKTTNNFEGILSEKCDKTSDDLSNAVRTNNLGLRTTENVSCHMSLMYALEKDPPTDVSPVLMSSAGGLQGGLPPPSKSLLAISESLRTLITEYCQSLTPINRWLQAAMVWFGSKLKRVFSSTLFTDRMPKIANRYTSGSKRQILEKEETTFMNLFQRFGRRDMDPQHNDYLRHLPSSSVSKCAPYGVPSALFGGNAVTGCNVTLDYPNEWASNTLTQKRVSECIEGDLLSQHILARLEHSEDNLRFNCQKVRTMVYPTQDGPQQPMMEFSYMRNFPSEFYPGKDWDYLVHTSDILPYPAASNNSLETFGLMPYQAGLVVGYYGEGWDGALPDLIDIRGVTQPVVPLDIPEVTFPEGYKSLAEVPTDFLEIIRNTFFEQLPGGYRKDCCLLQFRTEKNFATVQELSNLFSNYGDIEKVVYNEYLGAYLYCYINPSGVELSEKYLKVFSTICTSFSLLAYPSEEQIASVFFPPSISAQFTKHATFNPKKRFSVKNDGIPVKPNRIGKCLHVTYSGSDKSRIDLSTKVFQVLGDVRTVKKAKVDAEFETTQDAVHVVMKCHNMRVGVGQLRLAFTKNL